MYKKFGLRLIKTVLILVMISMITSLSVFTTQKVAAQESGPGDLTTLANRVATLPTNQIIIRYKALAEANAHPDGIQQMQRLSDAASISLAYGRTMSGEAHVLQLPRKMSLEQ